MKIGNLLRAGLLFLATLGQAQADALTPVRSGSLPELATGEAPVALVSMAGNPVVLGGDRAWQLSSDGSAWNEKKVVDPGLPDTIRAATGDGQRAFLLVGDAQGAVSLVHELVPAGTALSLRALPVLQSPLLDAQASVLGTNLYLAGRDGAGAARLLQLDLAARETCLGCASELARAGPDRYR